jgi:hypothetical protein
MLYDTEVLAPLKASFEVLEPLRFWGRRRGRLVDQVCRLLWLPAREHVRLGAGLEERDLQRPLADRVLAHELVQAAVPEQAVPVLVDVHAV